MGRENPLWIIKYLSFVNEFEHTVLLVVLPRYQKLINQFILLKYSWLYISAKKRNSWKSFNSLEGAWSAVACVQVLKLKPWYEPKKFPFEYWNNRILLMSLKNRFSSWFFQETKSSLTNFFCFNIRTFISLRKKRIQRQFTACYKERD